MNYNLTENGNQAKLLGTSTKTVKGERYNVFTKILYLAPFNRSGHNVCPYATEGCKSLCLGYTTGNLRMPVQQRAQVRKTNYFFNDRVGFLSDLHDEITKHQNYCTKRGAIAAIRLNGTSDILWERFIDLSQYKNVTFYDYTKIPLEFRDNLPNNYTLTYSISEHRDSHYKAQSYLSNKHNVAIVVAATTTKLSDAKKVVNILANSGEGIINGDSSDVRFFDRLGSVVALYAKGRKAITDNTGFVHRFRIIDDNTVEPMFSSPLFPKTLYRVSV